MFTERCWPKALSTGDLRRPGNIIVEAEHKPRVFRLVLLGSTHDGSGKNGVEEIPMEDDVRGLVRSRFFGRFGEGSDDWDFCLD
jgi:hypothetical protein